MTEGNGNQVFTDAAWAVWEPLIEAVRPHGKTPPQELRRTISAIFWRHQNGAKWRSIPAELGPWWLAAQLFIRWARQGVWERLLDLVQQHDIALGMTFLDGTNIRAHRKAAGAEKRGSTASSAMCARRLAALAAAMAQKPARSQTGAGAPSPSRSPRAGA
jgi:transposase